MPRARITIQLDYDLPTGADAQSSYETTDLQAMVNIDVENAAVDPVLLLETVLEHGDFSVTGEVLES